MLLNLQPKVFEASLVLPSTSMAAHANDEVVDIIEMDEKFELMGTASMNETEAAFKVPPVPFPPVPPPPVPENAYAQVGSNGTASNFNISTLSFFLLPSMMHVSSAMDSIYYDGCHQP